MAIFKILTINIRLFSAFLRYAGRRSVPEGRW